MSPIDKEKNFQDFVSRIESEELKESWRNSKHFIEKFFNYIYPDIISIKNPTILEFGVREGFSTSMFLDLCKTNNGTLYSVDINDHTSQFNDKNWHFIQSRDDNFSFVETKIPDKFDIILIDSLHTAKHVEKIIYHYFPKLKREGILIIDDISWLYYTPGAERDNLSAEIENRDTFFKLLEIFTENKDTLVPEFNFIASGVAKIRKKSDLPLNEAKKIKSREFKIIVLIKKIIKGLLKK